MGPNKYNLEGIGTTFVNRALLDAKSFEDAVNKYNSIPLFGGNNVNIMNLKNSTIVSMERYGYGNVGSIKYVNQPFLHTNQ
mmetsp:Transcript_11648/g.25482  ORF Transcript_11648/g.25482 Transcript_11648/m.25482 type:complete len:81 (+) Transcript_11648:595-837(+)